MHGNMQDKRVGRTDRDRYITHLANMVATEHLKDSEFDERRNRALVAVTVMGMDTGVTKAAPGSGLAIAT